MACIFEHTEGTPGTGCFSPKKHKSISLLFDFRLYVFNFSFTFYILYLFLCKPKVKNNLMQEYINNKHLGVGLFLSVRVGINFKQTTCMRITTLKIFFFFFLNKDSCCQSWRSWIDQLESKVWSLSTQENLISSVENRGSKSSTSREYFYIKNFLFESTVYLFSVKFKN